MKFSLLGYKIRLMKNGKYEISRNGGQAIAGADGKGKRGGRGGSAIVHGRGGRAIGGKGGDE